MDGSTTPISVSRATRADSDLLLTWRNDPSSVAFSLSGTAVERPDHEEWFVRSLSDPDRVIFIARGDDGVAFGMVRFDRRREHVMVSINLAPEARGHRLSAPILLAAIEAFRSEREKPDRLVAEIRETNTPSLALFLRVGFAPDSLEGGVWTYVL